MNGMQRPANDRDLLPKLRQRQRTVAARVGPPDAETGCQEWVGAFTPNGYGTLTVSEGDGRSRSVRAHRAVFMLFHGRAIAEGKELHHTCHNIRCVLPVHLVELTFDEHRAADATGGASVRYRPTKTGVPRWAVLFREDGKQRSRTFGSLEAAETFASQRLARTAA